MKLIILLFISFILIQPAESTVIFSEDFSEWSDFYFDSGYVYSGIGGWTVASGSVGADTAYSETYYAAEITQPGRSGASDRCMKQWRHDTYDFYDAGLNYREADLHTTRTLHIRWYMKIPADFEGTCTSGTMNYQKISRYSASVDVAGYELTHSLIYLNFNGSSFSGANMQITTTPTGGSWFTLKSVASMNDGEWHRHELMMKLNTEGNSDAEIKYWYDDAAESAPTVSSSGITWGSLDAEYFSRADFGLGNTGLRTTGECTSGSYQSSWVAIEFDDYVLSDSYIGTSGSTPSSSSYGSVKTGGSSSIKSGGPNSIRSAE